MNNLQNKLDKHGPPEFGRAALWNKIERPKRRRRMLFFWWALGATALVLGAFLWNNHWLSDRMVNTPTVNLPGKAEVKDEAEKGESTGSEKRKSPEANANFSIPGTNATPHGKWRERQGYLSASDDLSGQNRKMAPAKNSSDNRTTANTSARALLPLSPFAGLPEPRVSALPKSPAEKGTAAIRPLERLGSLPPALLNTMDNAQWNLDIPGARGSNGKSLRRNEFTIMLGAAGQWHLPDENQFNRRKEKPALPGHFLGARYKRKLSKGHYLLASLIYTYHQSKINASTTESEQFYDEFAGKAIHRTTTFYQLYNQYHRLDFAIGAGRSWVLPGFEVSLDAGLGAANWLKIEGDYLDDATAIQPMPGAEAVQATLFGRLNGELSRTLPNGFRLGLNISGQTPVRASPKGEDCRHRLLPVYLGMSIGKQF
ncbi:MAG: hypothetical protein KDD10_12685 [Phaeodactylibacter sp.]|nr:hypothetical protein [Phaeodactylibacter sp.]MCB9291773.1 hypothetical protein [Lewinellaceae bacterium]